MPRYLICLALAGVVAGDPFFMAQAFAGDGEVIVMREVPYQSANGQRHTGRVSAVDVSPDSQVTTIVNAASTRGTGALSELTDQESAAIASGVGSNTTALIPSLQHNQVLQGLASGKLTGTSGGALAQTSMLGSVTSGIGGGVGGSVGRATDTLGNALTGAMFHAGGMK